MRARLKATGWRFVALIVMIFAGAGCTEVVTRDNTARILLMGDSMFAWNQPGQAAVSHQLEKILGEEVIDRSVVGARFNYILPVSGAMGLRIPAQYTPGDWDYVVLNGGGNDIWMGCGCGRCDRLIDRLISTDGTSGAVPDLIDKITGQGSRVVYVGYLRSPGFTSGLEACVDEGRVFEGRIAKLARANPMVDFVSLVSLVPNGDRSFHDKDLMHPSRKGSAGIARQVAQVIAARD